MISAEGPKIVDESQFAGREKNCTSVESVLPRRSFGVAQEARVHARVSQGQGLPADLDRPILDRPHDVVCSDPPSLPQRSVESGHRPAGSSATSQPLSTGQRRHGPPATSRPVAILRRCNGFPNTHEFAVRRSGDEDVNAERLAVRPSGHECEVLSEVHDWTRERCGDRTVPRVREGFFADRR